MKLFTNVRLVAIHLLLLAFVIGMSAISTVTALAIDDLSVAIQKKARLIDGGLAAEVEVRARCTVENMDVLEAFVYVTQDGNTSNFASIPLTCSPSQEEQVFTIQVTAADFLFQRGKANASAFVLLVDPTSGDTLSTQDTSKIKIK